jgi:hypothetical protein
MWLRLFASALLVDRSAFVLALVAGLDIRQDLHQLADAAVRQRAADIHQRFVIVDPGLRPRAGGSSGWW